MLSKKNLILCLFVFILTLGIRLYFIGQKQGFFIDEIYTRTTVVGKFKAVNEMCKQPFKSFSAGSIKNWIFGKPETSIMEDVEQIWKNNYEDTAHPNLYFYLFRIGLNFSDFSPQGFLNFGCGLNLLFFTFSFFIMMKILIRLFGDNKLVPIGLALAFLNTGTISMTLFIRPYEMQILGIIFITYIYMIYEDKLKNSANPLSYKDICILIFSLTFVYLIGYFLVIYAAILGIFLLFKIRGNKTNFIILCSSAFLALLVALAFFPNYFQCIHDNRFYDVSKNYVFLENFLPRLAFSKNIFIDFIFYKIILFASVLTIIFCIDKNKTINKQCLKLIIFALIWEVIIAIITSYTLIRYFTPAFPILSLIILLLISKTKDKYQNFVAISFIVLYLAAAIFSFKQEFGSPTSYEKQNSKVLPYGAKIENLWAMPVPSLSKNIPVYICMYAELEPLNMFSRLNDNKNLVIKNMYANLKLDELDDSEFYLIYFDRIPKDNKLYEMEYLGKFLIFPTYYVRRINAD